MLLGMGDLAVQLYATGSRRMRGPYMGQFFRALSGRAGSTPLGAASGAPAHVADNSAVLWTMWRSRPIRLVIICGIILVGIVIAATASMLSNLRDRELAESERGLKRLALVLAEQIDPGFQSIKLIQTAVIERIQSLGTMSAATTMPRAGGRSKANLIAIVEKFPTPLNLCSAFRSFCATGSRGI